MKFFFVVIIILIGLSCTKEQGKDAEKKQPEIPARCGILLTTPVLDSFVYPTYYITAIVAFPEGNETTHFRGNVTGDHDGSWFLTKYDKDSSYCVAP